MGLFYTTIGAIVLSVVILVGYLITIVKGKKMRSVSNGKRLLSKEQCEQYASCIQNVTNNLNMKTITSVVTEFMYLTTQSTVNILKKLEIRKEISMHIDPAYNNKQTHMNIVSEDGKNDMTIESIHGSYSEKYIDNKTNKVLHKKDYKQASYQMVLIKSNRVEEKQELLCINCGDQVNIQESMVVCPSCGTKYSTENYKWSVSNARVANESQKGGIAWLVIGMIFLLVVMSLVVSALENPLFTSIMYGVNALLILVTLCYVGSVEHKLSGFKKLAKYDPNCSDNLFTDRVHYLFRLYEEAKDVDIKKIKAFVEPSFYERLKGQNKYDDKYLLDFEVINMTMKKFEVIDNKQIANVVIKLNEVTVNQRKRIKIKRKKVAFTMYRHKDTLTKILASPEFITCPSCGANINISADGKCKYCGKEYELDKYDWIIYNVR